MLEGVDLFLIWVDSFWKRVDLIPAGKELTHFGYGLIHLEKENESLYKRKDSLT